MGLPRSFQSRSGLWCLAEHLSRLLGHDLLLAFIRCPQPTAHQFPSIAGWVLIDHELLQLEI